MGTLTETAQIADKLQISLPEKPRELRLWLIDQVTILAEAFGEELTDARLRLYAQDLSEVARPQLEIAFGRARRELKFFPKISELLEMAGAKPEDARKVESDAAWNHALDYLRKWGVDRMPVYSGGKRIDAPMLPPRIEYALRRVGGLWGLNQITSESRPFVQKDFTEAYQQAPIAESLAPQLGSMFGDRKLLGHVKQLTAGVAMNAPPITAQKHEPAPTFKAKPIPVAMTEAQLRDRREMLRQQARSISIRRP